MEVSHTGNPYVDAVKIFAGIISTIFLSIFAPIKIFILILAGAWVFNFSAGLATDVWINKQEFDLKKAFASIFQGTFIAAFIYYVHNSAVMLGYIEYANKADVGITVFSSYYYITNTFKNATKMWPQNKFFYAMYIILSTKIFVIMKQMLGLGSDKQIPND